MSSSLEGIHGEKMTRFDLTDLASSPTSPDVGGSKVVVVASSIEPSTDLRALSSFIPAVGHMEYLSPTKQKCDFKPENNQGYPAQFRHHSMG